MSAAFKRITFIITSTRTPRAGSAVAKAITGIITPLLPAYTVIDLMDHPLPLYTRNPSSQPASHPAIKFFWSALVRSFDAFIFLTPQYNWGYPASLKLALDALYHEWNGKAALVLSHGVRGGGLAANQLRQALAGLHMRVCERGVELPFGEGHKGGGSEFGQETNDRWKAESKQAEMVQACDELVGLISTA
ncbi:putative flavoprotein [Mycena latifolia]|nr:putative flavoprotein [Mycena latifolia]